MLTNYLNATRRLLQNPAASTSLYSDPDLTIYINTARGQVAGEAECIRRIGTLAAVVGQQAYDFSSVNVGAPSSTGIDGIIHVRSLQYSVAAGQRWISPRSWEWFEFYCLNNPAPSSGNPTDWAQYGQGASPSTNVGAAAGGSLYVYPLPNTTYTLSCDCVCYPVPLDTDGTREAIPYLWTDAVPYFAAYLAYLSSQTGARQADAARMYQLYEEFMRRARQATNPSVNRWVYQQSPDPVQINKIARPREPAQGGGG